MPSKYLTKSGDMLDEIAYKFYGYADSIVLNAIIEANPKTLEDGAQLPEGRQIVLPDLEPKKSQKTTVRLWD